MAWRIKPVRPFTYPFFSSSEVTKPVLFDYATRPEYVTVYYVTAQHKIWSYSVKACMVVRQHNHIPDCGLPVENKSAVRAMSDSLTAVPWYE
jgi:hypothetical protein